MIAAGVLANLLLALVVLFGQAAVLACRPIQIQVCSWSPSNREGQRIEPV